MSESMFSNSRKLLGIPLVILLVAVIAMVSGGIALGSYLTRTATVNITVHGPLSYYFTQDGWVDEGGGVYSWSPDLSACGSETNSVVVTNTSGADVPLSVQANSSNPVDGVDCLVSVWDDQGFLSEVVPAGESVRVDVVIAVSCAVVIPESGFVQTTWTIQFREGS